MASQLSMSQGLSQAMTMQLTPSQRLSLEILQLNIQSLEQRIQEELETNPLLEVKNEAPESEMGSGPITDEGGRAEARESEESGAESRDRMSAPGAESPRLDHVHTDETQEQGEETEYDVDHKDMVREYLEPYWEESEYSATAARSKMDGEAEDNIMDSVAAKGDDFQEHLREQIEFLNPPKDLRRHIFEVIYHLDDRGYLGMPIEELAKNREKENLDPELLKSALDFVQQKLDPPGLGARDLRECLFIQLRRLGDGFELEEKILGEHFDALLNNRLDDIASAMSVSVERVKESLELFSSMEFRPSRDFKEDDERPVRPDAVVKYEPPDELRGRKARFLIQLTRKGMPELEVVKGNTYTSSALSKQEKRFVIERTQSARALIEAIRRRNETLFLVIQAICQRQEYFFEEGREGLTPLLQQQIAADVRLSAATVARTVKDKYIQTDFGIFPLKFFFSKKMVTTSDGEESDRDDILEALAKIVREEDKLKPASDAAIARALAGKGYAIATRTVSKYRELMDLPASSKRRKF